MKATTMHTLENSQTMSEVSLGLHEHQLDPKAHPVIKVERVRVYPARTGDQYGRPRPEETVTVYAGGRLLSYLHQISEHEGTEEPHESIAIHLEGGELIEIQTGDQFTIILYRDAD